MDLPEEFAAAALIDGFCSPWPAPELLIVHRQGALDNRDSARPAQHLPRFGDALGAELRAQSPGLMICLRDSAAHQSGK
jgi:hypothetical protein